MKILKKSEQEDPNNLYLEVDILSKLNHPNIMQVYEFYEDSKFFYIISEFCSGGELFDQISEKGIFTEAEACLIMKQILSAVSYIHSNNIVHRDIKPENILLDDKTDTPLVKLIDWGGAKYFAKNKKLNQISGTAYYIAPEVLDEVYDEKCDVWSCGVILYILLSGTPPFNGKTDSDILRAVKKGRYEFKPDDWQDVSREAIDLIKSMIKYNTKERLSALECLNHSWFKKTLNVKDSKKPISSIAAKNMKQFSNFRKLEQATVSYIVNQLISKDERNELLNHFQSWDVNGDGVLSREELFNGYKSLFGEIKAIEEVVFKIFLL